MFNTKSFFEYAHITDSIVKLSKILKDFMRSDDKQAMAGRELVKQRLYSFDDLILFMQKVGFDMD